MFLPLQEKPRGKGASSAIFALFATFAVFFAEGWLDYSFDREIAPLSSKVYNEKVAAEGDIRGKELSVSVEDDF